MYKTSKGKFGFMISRPQCHMLHLVNNPSLSIRNKKSILKLGLINSNDKINIEAELELQKISIRQICQIDDATLITPPYEGIYELATGIALCILRYKM